VNQVGENLGLARNPLDFIHVWRDQLIDLTKRNALLSFKAPKTSSITIAHPNASEAATYLLDSGQVPLTHMRVLIKTEAPEETIEAGVDKQEGWRRRDLLLPGTLYADLSEPDLRTRARAIERRTTQEFLDRGLLTLYLAYGQLIWRDVDDEEYRAPLLLIPVAIASNPDRGNWTLARIDEDVVLNPAIQIKASQFGVVLPAAVVEQDEFELSQWLATVNTSVKEIDGWRAEESAVLSRFSFFKEAMYRDLLENEDVIAAHDVIRAIVDPESAALTEREVIDPTSIDQTLPP
jgi:hypothetical protein